MKIYLQGLFMIFLIYSNAVYAQRTELGTLKDHQSLKTFYKEKKQEEKDTYRALWRYIMIDSATWNSIPVKDISVFEDHIELTADEKKDFASARLLQHIRQQHKDAVSTEAGYSNTSYTVNNNDMKLKLKVEAVEDDSIGRHTASQLRIYFKEQYTQPLANISSNVPPDPQGKFYYLDLNTFNVNTEVWLNGINIYNLEGRYRYINNELPVLNRYLLGKEPVHLKVIIKPGYNEDGSRMSAITKEAYCMAKLCKGVLVQGTLQCLEEKPFCNFMEYVTDTTFEDGRELHYTYRGNTQYGKARLECSLDFTPDVAYRLEGWRNGSDLRTDTKLKERIIALYQRLADAIRNKDEVLLSQLLYRREEEIIKSTYNMLCTPSADTWKAWMEMLGYTNSLKIEQDFGLAFSEDGKLVMAQPKSQPDMLRAIGKQKAEGFTLFMYEDKNTRELQFIR